MKTRALAGGGLANPPVSATDENPATHGPALQQTIAHWATNIDPGAPDESGQTLTFTATLGQSDPAPQSVTVSNSGGGTLNWQATPADNWLNINPGIVAVRRCLFAACQPQDSNAKHPGELVAD